MVTVVLNSQKRKFVQHRILKIVAVSELEWLIKGKKVKTNTSQTRLEFSKKTHTNFVFVENLLVFSELMSMRITNSPIWNRSDRVSQLTLPVFLKNSPNYKNTIFETQKTFQILQKLFFSSKPQFQKFSGAIFLIKNSHLLNPI
jgi:hypothetical protein